MTIYEKLGAIQQALKAPKSEYNDFGKYKYRTAEGILESVKPLLAEQKCVLLLRDDLESKEGRVYIKATASLFDIEAADNGTISAVAFAREEETKKGMDASQVTGAASSYARKYAMSGLFAIDGNEDSDITNNTPKDTPKDGETFPDETRTEKNDFPFCQECGKRITEDERFYSVRYFKQALCRDCQKKRRKK